jgi:membrane carboxypeptidase/penicillin-binding protein PbpC
MVSDVEFDVEFVKSAARKLVEEIYRALALAMAIKDEVYESDGNIDWVGLDVVAQHLDDHLNNAYEELHKIMWVVSEKLQKQLEQQVEQQG